MVNGFVKQVQRCPRYFPRAKVLINAVTGEVKYWDGTCSITLRVGHWPMLALFS
jgi:hypothetical protein